MRRIWLLLPLLSIGVACATPGHWADTRSEVIDPIHALLHHTYPESYETMDPAELQASFTDAEAAAPSLALLATFGQIERGNGYIESVDLEAQPVTARVRLRVEGVDADGKPRSVRQEKRFELARGPDGWRIARDLSDPYVVVPAPSAHFFDETPLRGLWFRHEGKDKRDLQGQPRRYVYGSGIAATDLDGDGWDDLILATGERIEVYANEEGRFRYASEDLGLGKALPSNGSRIWNVVVPADFDNDGYVDLFVGAEFGQPLLLRGSAEGFRAVTDSGLETSERTISATVADFDGDGRLDLYLANHEDEFREAPNPPWSKNAHADQLYRNEGGLRFRDVTEEAGLGNRGWSLTPVAADYDGDGDVDLFVGNDFGFDVLYQNDGAGRFSEVSDDVGLDRPVASMGADWGDYDGDGDLDLFVGGMSSNAGWVLEAPDFKIRKVPGFVDWMFRPYVREYVRAWFRGNRFYENQGDGTFREIAREKGVDAHGWSWATVWLDFDNDGHLDLYALNGFITGALEDDL
ncbi:MAG: VCBS repeat-containing protein [Myxococcota bacterium]